MNIPKNCIKTFKNRYNTYPSILEIVSMEGSDKINEFFSNYTTLWRRVYSDCDKVKTTDKLIDYDPTGIMIYINEGVHIFIMTTERRMDVAQLTLSRLRKILK